MRHEHHLPPPQAARAIFVLGERHPGCTSHYCEACELCTIDEEGVPIEHACPVEDRGRRAMARREAAEAAERAAARNTETATAADGGEVPR